MLVDKDLLTYWINERETIRLKKEAHAKKPWSEDPVFQTVYFTNVRREDDKTTKYFRRCFHHFEDWAFLTPLFVVARMFNLPSHFEVLPNWHDFGQYEFWAPRAKEATLSHRARGEKLFSGAYLITTCGVKMDKVDYVYRVADDANHLTFNDCNTLDGYHRRLTSVNGLGSFLAAQVVADLKNTRNHPLSDAVDWFEWCAPGPGSLRGIRRVEGYQGTSEGQFQAAATRLYHSISAQLQTDELHMQDFQNCLCEFDKYVRVKQGTGRSKRKYNGRGE